MKSEEFKIESKGSTIGLIIKVVIFSILVNQFFNFLERIIGEFSAINGVLIGGTVVYIIYRHFTDKTVITIADKKLLTESFSGIPNKHLHQEFDLNSVKQIRLVQSHDFVYGKKKMEVVYATGQKQIVDLKLRYYQLVKLEEYLNHKLNINTRLIG